MRKRRIKDEPRFELIKQYEKIFKTRFVANQAAALKKIMEKTKVYIDTKSFK